MEPEPTLVHAEPVHEPEDIRSAMRQKLATNLAAVGCLADLSAFAHKMQPDLVPADVTVTEDTVMALLRAVVALTLVPPPMETAAPPAARAPQPTPAAQASPARHERPRMMHTPSFLDTCTDGGRRRELIEKETVDMVLDASGAAASSRARAEAHLAGVIEHETHAEGLGGAFGDDEPDSADPAGAGVLWQAIQAEGHGIARETATAAAAVHESSAHRVLPSLHVEAQRTAMARRPSRARRGAK